MRGAVLTLKMNDADMAAKIPELLQRVRDMGFASVRATQLPTNRREVCVVALTSGPGEKRAKRVTAKTSRTKATPSASRRGSRAPTSK